MSKSNFPVLSAAGQIPVKLDKELVVVDEWELQVWVHELTAGDVDAYRAPMYEWDEEAGKMRLNMNGQNVRICVYAIHDENGNRIFNDVEAGIEAVNALGSAGVAVVAKVANRLSKLSGDASKAIEGNSEAGQTGASPSN